MSHAAPLAPRSPAPGSSPKGLPRFDTRTARAAGLGRGPCTTASETKRRFEGPSEGCVLTDSPWGAMSAYAARTPTLHALPRRPFGHPLSPVRQGPWEETHVTFRTSLDPRFTAHPRRQTVSRGSGCLPPSPVPWRFSCRSNEAVTREPPTHAALSLSTSSGEPVQGHCGDTPKCAVSESERL